MIINEIGSLCTHRISHYPPILHNCSERPLFECKINFKSSSASYRLVLWKLYLWYEGKNHFNRYMFSKTYLWYSYDGCSWKELYALRLISNVFITITGSIPLQVNF